MSWGRRQPSVVRTNDRATGRSHWRLTPGNVLERRPRADVPTIQRSRASALRVGHAPRWMASMAPRLSATTAVAKQPALQGRGEAHRATSRDRSFIVRYGCGRRSRGNELVVPCPRKENHQDGCENCDSGVPDQPPLPEVPRSRRRRLGPRRHGLDEPIASPGHGLNKSSVRAVVAQNRSKATDDDVKAVVRMNVPVRPQRPLDLLARDQLAGSP